MFTYELVIAAALVTAPADAASPKELPSWFMPLRAALVRVGIDAQILDRREEEIFLLKAQDFPADVHMLRRRYVEFLHAPLIEECGRFPNRETALDFVHFNRAYRTDLLARMTLDPVHAEELRGAVEETDRLFQIWDQVREARCGFYFVTVRRQALMLLRQLVGNEAFYTGQLPPHVPVWRFVTVR
ncbi:MAG: hypothetical protein L0Y72_26535 [Gemmataceae bacterium]|nr:hypothetical protein [Gemmataceae bacterium]MCI0742606.1 hypothetical protein [Gemmataceae bacterium]